ncbi:hypothetical protein T310_10093, partial [Rasamsonia emersonii CBS 393.64]
FMSWSDLIRSDLNRDNRISRLALFQQHIWDLFTGGRRMEKPDICLTVSTGQVNQTNYMMDTYRSRNKPRTHRFRLEFPWRFGSTSRISHY